jgi:hypothetical protein
MSEPQTEPLADHALAYCNHCKAPIWRYSMPGGEIVSLENAPGPYFIVGTTAYKSNEAAAGYRSHWDYCRKISCGPLSRAVVVDEFLWRSRD